MGIRRVTSVASAIPNYAGGQVTPPSSGAGIAQPFTCKQRWDPMTWD